MEIDLGNGVKRKDVEGIKRRNQRILDIILWATVMLAAIKITLIPGMRWIIVFIPIVISLLLGLIILMVASLIMRYAKDF